jgi:bis(5'-nucleosyl)-tetraphosphatase (symmetrical)
MKRTIAVGDVHGCIWELNELLNTLQYSPSTDRLVFLGDLMDRGPDPVACVRRVRELGAEMTIGNHELSHMKWRKNEDAFKATGKKNMMRHIGSVRAEQNKALSDEDIEWMKNLPLTIQLDGGFVAVHGGFQNGLPIHDQNPDKIVRMRYLDRDTHKPLPLEEDFEQPPNSVFWSTVWNGPEHVVYGHAVMGNDPFHHRKVGEPPFELFRDFWPEEIHTVGIDTGACYGGRLTAMVTEDGFKTWTYVQVQSKEQYYEPVAGVHKATNHEDQTP